METRTRIIITAKSKSTNKNKTNEIKPFLKQEQYQERAQEPQ